VRRGEIWTVAGGSGYAGKPRPAAIVQDDEFDETDSLTICAFTTTFIAAPLFRVDVIPNERNNLVHGSWLMADKLTTLPKTKFGSFVGRLDDQDMLHLNQAIFLFLGLAMSPRTARER
jgi:mRNA interferase MazF